MRLLLSYLFIHRRISSHDLLLSGASAGHNSSDSSDDDSSPPQTPPIEAPSKHKDVPHKRETVAGDFAGGRDRIVLPESFLKEIGKWALSQLNDIHYFL